MPELRRDPLIMIIGLALLIPLGVGLYGVYLWVPFGTGEEARHAQFVGGQLALAAAVAGVVLMGTVRMLGAEPARLSATASSVALIVVTTAVTATFAAKEVADRSIRRFGTEAAVLVELGPPYPWNGHQPVRIVR